MKTAKALYDDTANSKPSPYWGVPSREGLNILISLRDKLIQNYNPNEIFDGHGHPTFERISDRIKSLDNRIDRWKHSLR